MRNAWKAVRTDRELECQEIDEGLRAAGVDLVTLPDGTSEDALIAAVREADLLLMCYASITARVIAGAPRLKGIVNMASGSTRSTLRPRWRAASGRQRAEYAEKRSPRAPSR